MAQQMVSHQIREGVTTTRRWKNVKREPKITFNVGTTNIFIGFKRTRLNKYKAVVVAMCPDPKRPQDFNGQYMIKAHWNILIASSLKKYVHECQSQALAWQSYLECPVLKEPFVNLSQINATLSKPFKPNLEQLAMLTKLKYV